MLRPSPPIGPPTSLLALALGLLLLVTSVGGCASSRSPGEVASARNEVLGVWEYRTNGTRILQRGTLQISVKDGRLVGRIKDSWRGKIEAPIRLHGSHMELNLDRARITGKLRRGRFEASIQREFWGVSQQSGRRQSRGYFVARQVRSQSTSGDPTDVGCTSLLRESSYMCSPFQSE